MSYINSTINDDETVVAVAKVSRLSYLSYYILAALLVPLTLGVGTALVLLFIYLAIKTNEMAVTSERLIQKSGLISRNTNELQLSRIEGVMVKQGILGRVLGYGSVIATGTGAAYLTFKNVKDPIALRKAIDTAAKGTTK